MNDLSKPKILKNPTVAVYYHQCMASLRFSTSGGCNATVKSHVDSGTQEPSMVDLPTVSYICHKFMVHVGPMDGPWGKKASCKADAMHPSSTQISHPYEVKQMYQKIPQFLLLRFVDTPQEQAI